MSTYFSVFTCQTCAHQVVVGFIGETNSTVAFCAACAQAFRVAPPSGEILGQSRQDHRLFTFGQERVTTTSKKGRITKTVTRRAWVDTGLRIPIEETLVEIGGRVHIDHTFRFQGLACPACHTQDELMPYHAYVAHCPGCNAGPMIESSL